jgi:hypothetical protein
MGDINPEEVLRYLTNLEGAEGYVIYNSEGIYKIKIIV